MGREGEARKEVKRLGMERGEGAKKKEGSATTSYCRSPGGEQGMRLTREWEREARSWRTRGEGGGEH